MTVKQLASKFHEEKNLLSREEHFSFSSEYKLLTKWCYMLNSNLVNVYSFALNIYFQTEILSNRGTDAMVSQDNFFTLLQQNAHSTAPECLLTAKDFTHSSNWCNVSFLLYNPIKWDYKWRDRQITCMFLYASLSYEVLWESLPLLPGKQRSRPFNHPQ